MKERRRFILEAGSLLVLVALLIGTSVRSVIHISDAGGIPFPVALDSLARELSGVLPDIQADSLFTADSLTSTEDTYR